MLSCARELTIRARVTSSEKLTSTEGKRGGGRPGSNYFSTVKPASPRSRKAYAFYKLLININDAKRAKGSLFSLLCRGKKTFPILSRVTARERRL